MKPVLQFEAIEKTYQSGDVEVRAVRGVTFTVHEGEFLAIMGSSGSGKSTMMNILGCLDRPTHGRYLLDGTDVSELDRDRLADIRNKKIGFVFQGFNLLTRTSALENVELPMLYSHQSLTTAEIHQRARAALTAVGLAERAGHYPNQLSGGQQQRVAIARALCNEPALILADEPTGNLDSRTSVEIMGVFQKLNDQGITIVMVTHEADIASFTKRNIVMRDGQVLSDKPVARRLIAVDELRRLDEAHAAIHEPAPARAMRLAATFRIALRALRRNKLRTGLTMLGIVIGVGAVVAMVGIGSGAKAQVEAQIASLGENVILIMTGSTTSSGIRTGFGQAGTLKIEDVDAILREIPAITSASAEVRSTMSVASGNQNWTTQILGESPDYFSIRQWPLKAGATFTEQDVRGANKVCVIGQTTARLIYGDSDPLGQIIRIKQVPFIITGVLSPKGMSMMGTDQDDVVIMPYTSAMKRVMGRTTLGLINVQAATKADLAPAQQQLISLLRQRHRISPGKDDDFTVRSQEEIAEAATATSRVLAVLLGAIASVSLLVGGIGIMNIMLVSVTERTREIGIRMAVGAHGRDILLQFLIESICLSSLGGIIGIGLGIATARILAVSYQWPTLISPTAILVAFGFSAAVGIFFGFYPARKAAALDPIDALRYE